MQVSTVHHRPTEADIGQCVACGLCLPHCPTFRITGRETASPRGRIAAMRAVVEDGAAIDGSFITMMDECLACRACEAACPSGVPFGRMIEAARAMAEPYRPARGRMLRRIGLGFVLRRRRVIKTMALGLGLTQALRLDRLLPTRLTAGTPRVSLRGMREPVPAELGHRPRGRAADRVCHERGVPTGAPSDDATAGAGRVPRHHTRAGRVLRRAGRPLRPAGSRTAHGTRTHRRVRGRRRRRGQQRRMQRAYEELRRVAGRTTRRGPRGPSGLPRTGAETCSRSNFGQNVVRWVA